MKQLLIALALIYLHPIVFALEDSSLLILGSQCDGRKIEIAVQSPSTHKAPLLLFLHGASSGKGLRGISESWFNHWLEKGYAVGAISMPGYGESTGPKDFCGPFTMTSLNFAIDAIKDKVDVADFGIVGFGQGGVASILLASQRADIRCVVCANGCYDLFRHKIPGDKLMNVLQKSDYCLDIEDVQALVARSAILHIVTIDAPLFLLHRKGNPTIGEDEVMDFYYAMVAAQKECHISIKDKAPDSDAQILTYEEMLAETEEWVDCKMQ